jgi:hypothetical protein
VIDAATKLLNAVNVALRLNRCNGFELLGIVERRNGAIHRTMLCGSGVYRTAGGELRVNGKPVRSKEERLVSLMGHNEGANDIARALSRLPRTWPELRRAYETVKGTMSSKPNQQEARADHKNLTAKGWLTDDEAERFYDPVTFYSHGHPKSPMKTSDPMSYEEACELVERLFWRLVDELEPT